MAKKLDIINYSRVFDLFGEQAANDAFYGVQDGSIDESELEARIYDDESKEDYRARIRREYQEYERSLS